MKDQETTVDYGASQRDRGLHRLPILLASMTLILLVAGALVTTNDAGDSVPDWPLSFGRWVITSNHFVANVRYEYSHLVIAFLVGTTALALAHPAWTTGDRPLIRKLALVVGLVAVTSAGWREGRLSKEDSGFPSARRLAIITGCAVLAQVALGARFRHGAFGVVGALTVASMVVLGLRCCRTLSLARDSKGRVRVSLDNSRRATV